MVLVGTGCALPWIALGEPASGTASRGWIPALAAWGEGTASSSGGAASASAPLLLAGGLAAVAVPDPGSTSAATAGAPDTSSEFAPEDETTRWVPSLAAISRLIGQKAEGSVDSTSTVRYRLTQNPVVNVPGLKCPVPAPTNPTCRVPRQPATPTSSVFTRPISVIVGGATTTIPPLPDVGRALMLTPASLGSLELMTPGVQAVPGRPRLFAHGDLGAAFSFDEWTVAKQATPDSLEYPVPTPPNFNTLQIKGQGALTSAKVKTMLAGGGVGVAFSVDVGERRIRIKPSVEYLRETIGLTGLISRAYTVNNGRAAINNNVLQTQTYFPGFPSYPEVPTQIDNVVIKASDTEVYHGIGPGLEVEMDAGRAGPVVLSLFVQGQAYRLLGNRDTTFTGTTTLTDAAFTPNPQTVSAEFKFHPHAWTYQGGMGLRFRWLPEAGWWSRR
jgi:hypothetical protein